MAKRVQQKRAQRRRRVLRAQRRAPLRRPAHHARTEDAAARVVRAIGHRAQALIQAYALSTRPARHLPPVQATEMPPPRMVEALYTLVHRVLALAEEGIRLVRREAPPKLPLACGKGCAWCCSLQVPVSAPEVLLLAEALRQTRSPDSLAAVRERVAALDARTRGLDDVQRLAARLPCALLENGLCSVYGVRPLACRGWNSYDARVCRHAVEYTTAPVARLYAPQVAITDHLRATLAAGLGAAAASAQPVAEPKQVEDLELTAALRIALETPDAAARWLAGEPLFAPARLPPRARRAGGAPPGGPMPASDVNADTPDPGANGV